MLTSIPNIEKRLRTLRSSSLPTEQVEKVASNLQRGDANWRSCIECLRNEIEERDLANLDIANSVAEISDENIPLVSAIVQDDEVFTLKEFALKYNLGKLTQLLASFVAPTMTAATEAVALAVATKPDAIPESIKETARSIRRKLFEHEPTGVLCSMIDDGEFPVADKFVRTKVSDILRISDDIRRLAAEQVGAHTYGLPEDQQRMVRREIEAAKRLINYGVDSAVALKRAGLTSSFSVSTIPESKFVERFGASLGETEARRLHAQASAATVHYNNTALILRDAIRGSGLAIIDGVKPKDGKESNEESSSSDRNGNEQAVPFNLEEIFSDSDRCECGHCSSVYSPAAYYVELLEFLRTGNMPPTPDGLPYPPGMIDTPLEKLLRRRPDLADLELSCENTNTVLPYVDLCNEVMESYVTYLDLFKPDEFAKVDVFNVDKKTQSSTLLAAPENTRYKYKEAYGKLSVAVYPFTLPYHQPIDEARILLEYLETNRAELLDVFRSQIQLSSGTANEDAIRKWHEVAQQRAVDAEALGLTQEQYVILTQEGFYPRDFYAACGTARNEQEYRDDIRVHKVFEYYGYKSEAEMLDRNESGEKTGLTFVKKQFLPRTGITYTDLVELLQTRYVNPEQLEGPALAFLKRIKFSYRYLQSKIKNGDKTDLIAFLKAEMPCSRNEVEEWVNEHFDNLGKLIVLESGEPEFSIVGDVYLRSRNDGVFRWRKVGELKSDGIIWDGNAKRGIVSGDRDSILEVYRVFDANDLSRSYFRSLQETYGEDLVVHVRGNDGRVLARISDEGIFRERLGLVGRIVHRSTSDNHIGDLWSDGNITIPVGSSTNGGKQFGLVNAEAAVLISDPANANADYVPLTTKYSDGQVLVLKFENDDIQAKIVSETDGSGAIIASRLVQSQLSGIEENVVRVQSSITDVGTEWKELGRVDKVGQLTQNSAVIGKVRLDNSVVDLSGVSYFNANGRKEIDVRRRLSDGTLQNRIAFITNTGLLTGTLTNTALTTGNQIAGLIFASDDDDANPVAVLTLDGNIRAGNAPIGLVDLGARVFANDRWFCNELGGNEFFIKTSSTESAIAKIVKREVGYKRLVRAQGSDTIDVTGRLVLMPDGRPLGTLYPDGRVLADDGVTLIATVANDSGDDNGQVYATDGKTLLSKEVPEGSAKRIELISDGDLIGDVIKSGLVVHSTQTPPPSTPTKFEWKTTTRSESYLVAGPEQILAAKGNVVAIDSNGNLIEELGLLNQDGEIKKDGAVLARVVKASGNVSTPGSEVYFDKAKETNAAIDKIHVLRQGVPIGYITSGGLFKWGDDDRFTWEESKADWVLEPYKWEDVRIQLGKEPISWLHWDRCDLDRIRLQHLDGNSVTCVEYGRLHLIVRLWRILGWSIAQVGTAINGLGKSIESGSLGVCFPCSGGTTQNVSLHALSPELIHNLVYVKKILGKTGIDLDELLSFWGEIDIHGENSLYAKLFLTHNISNFDDVFVVKENELFLPPPYELIQNHVPVLMAALRLTAEDLNSILHLIEARKLILAGSDVSDPSVQATIEQNVQRSELTLENVSAIFRLKQLAGLLGIRDLFYLPFVFQLADKSVQESLANHFAEQFPMLDPSFGDPFRSAEEFWKLLEFWMAMEDAGLTFEQIVYIVLGIDHPSRKIGMTESRVQAAKKAMFDAVNAVSEKHKDIIPEDEETFSSAVAKEKIGLWYDSEVTDSFVAFLENTRTYTALNGPVSSSAADIVIPDDLKSFLSYEWETGVVKTTQVLLDDDRDHAFRLSRRPEWKSAIESLYDQPRAFLEQYIVGFYNEPEKDRIRGLLLDPETKPTVKRREFLETFVPFLRNKLRCDAIIAATAVSTGLNLDSSRVLLEDIIKTYVPASGSTPAHWINAISALERSVLENPSVWQGKLVVSATNDYSFFVKSVGQPLPLLLDGKELAFGRGEFDPKDLYSTPRIRLDGGRQYVLAFHGLIAELKWKTPTSKLDVVPSSRLIPAVNPTDLQIFEKLAKVVFLIDALKLNTGDLRYWHQLKIPDPKDPANAIDLRFDFNQVSLTLLRNLIEYAEVRDKLPKKEKSLLSFLEWAKQPSSGSLPDEWPLRIVEITEWKAEQFTSLTSSNHLGIDVPQYFTGPRNFRRLRRALEVANGIGIKIASLFEWSLPFRIPPNSSDPNSGWPKTSFKRYSKHAAQVRQVIKSRFKQSDWEQVVKPLNDELRTNQRDALAAYLVTQAEIRRWGVTDTDSLFEFLLIDPQMASCLETSRIKQAISSVQLFIHRAMLGLEERHGVKGDATILNRERWEWMQKYRVWEANRKVFLYPENWIKPELRDDKSPLYKEFESELLQADINQQVAEDLIRTYVAKVDEISNLQAVGLFYEKEKEFLHVVSRTRNSPHLYYYRLLDIDNAEWSPWESVPVDIPTYDVEIIEGAQKGTFVTPVVFNSQLYIFFPIIVRKTKENNTSQNQSFTGMGGQQVDAQRPRNYLEIKLAWTEKQKSRWTTKQVSVDHLTINDVNAQNLVVVPRIFASNGTEGQVLVSILRGSERIGEFSFKRNQVTATGADGTLQTGSASADAYHYRGQSLYSFQGIDKAAPHLFGNPPFVVDKDQGNATSTTSGSTISFTSGNDRLIESQPLWHESSSGLVNKSNGASALDSLFATLNDVDELQPQQVANTFGRYDNEFGTTDFDELKRPYSLYNWELGFHIPMFLSERLKQSQLFDPAIKMLRYVLDPYAAVDSDASGSQRQRFWKFYPFKKTDARDFLSRLFIDQLRPRVSNKKITQWRDKPFRPHLVARGRPSAYMKWTAMKYIELLIEYGDYYFRQNSLETLQLAIQMYVMAAHAYGPKGQDVPASGKKKPQSYRSLLARWDAFGNAMVQLETEFPFSSQTPFRLGQSAEVTGAANIFGFAGSLYFCIPDNPQMLALREKIDDRLFKIRHCQDIDGNVRKLPLFDPPIDPALLVQAVAQGLSITSVVNDLNSPMPNYRFAYLLQKALELCNEVKSLGNALLSVKEKKDTEKLARLRSKHEIAMNDLVMNIRKMQLEESERALAPLEDNRTSVAYRMKHFLQLAGEDTNRIPQPNADFSELQNRMETPVDESDLKLIRYEKEELDKAQESSSRQSDIGKIETLANILHALPMIGAHGTPLGCGLVFNWGPPNLANAASAVARGMRIGADNLSFQSSRASRKGGFLRQLQDRIQQANMAGYEIKNIDRQILAHRIRIDIARKEIDNHQKQIDNTKEIYDHLKDKFTNEELYTSMEGELKKLYYQAYTLASEIAKKAEKTFCFERGMSTSGFIEPGYWEGGNDGLLAGERLYGGLKRLEAAYQENRGYDYEITKHVSLRDLNPLALSLMRQTGTCEFSIPESLFDMDFPGQFKRRIKSVSVSVPCVVGPHANLSCTLRLLTHKFRHKSTLPKGYAEQAEDERFMTTNIPISAIATSSGQNDSGVFELNFKDERYLPFEGAGAISAWRLDLPSKIRQFDYGTISDVILHIKYTSVEGGEALANEATEHVSKMVATTKDMARDQGLFAVLDLKHDLSTQWSRFVSGSVTNRELNLNDEIIKRVPYVLGGIHATDVKLHDLSLVSAEDDVSKYTIKLNGSASSDVPFGNGESKITMKLYSELGIDVKNGAAIKLSNETGDVPPMNNLWAIMRLTFVPK